MPRTTNKTMTSCIVYPQRWSDVMTSHALLIVIANYHGFCQYLILHHSAGTIIGGSTCPLYAGSSTSSPWNLGRLISRPCCKALKLGEAHFKAFKTLKFGKNLVQDLEKWLFLSWSLNLKFLCRTYLRAKSLMRALKSVIWWLAVAAIGLAVTNTDQSMWPPIAEGPWITGTKSFKF
jgi:hypothetical protein